MFAPAFIRMNDSSPIEARRLAAEYFAAEDEQESCARLERLHAAVVRPLVSRLLKAKLHASMSAGDASERNQDAMEIMRDVEVAILDRLIELKNGGAVAEISNLEGYIHTAARNAFSQMMRRRFPVRSSLANQLRYILTHKSGLELFKGHDGDWMCCVASGRKGEEAAEHRSLGDLEREAIEAEAAERCAGGTLTELTLTLLELHGGPVLLDLLIDEVFRIRGMREPRFVDEEAGGEAKGKEVRLDLRFEQSEELLRMWEEICRLPVMHRRALILNLKDRGGNSVATELPLLRVASVSAIARALELEPDEFAEIWRQLPLNDKQIAERFSLSRQQVINLRHSARAALKRRLKKQQ